MRLTKQQLAKIIQEELNTVLGEKSQRPAQIPPGYNVPDYQNAPRGTKITICNQHAGTGDAGWQEYAYVISAHRDRCAQRNQGYAGVSYEDGKESCLWLKSRGFGPKGCKDPSIPECKQKSFLGLKHGVSRDPQNCVISADAARDRKARQASSDTMRQAMQRKHTSQHDTNAEPYGSRSNLEELIREELAAVLAEANPKQ